MSKVICDVCGTAFAETADQCPICGTAKSDQSRPVPGGEGESSGYAYVKGGRFSHSNVRRHNSGKKELPRTPAEEKPRKAPKEEPPVEMPQPADGEEAPAPAPRRAPRTEAPAQRPERKPRRENRDEPEDEQPSNVGLIIVVVVLLLAIISLCAYIAIRYIDLNNSKNSTGSSSSSSDYGEVPCTGVSIPGSSVYTLTRLGDEVLIEVVCEPANTTDLLNWNYDNTIVNVIKSENGWIITPVGPGEAVITVSCGAYSASLSITCDLSEIPCTGVEITGVESHTFQLITDELVLDVVCQPAATTDTLTWTYDETVVHVEQRDGRWVITPVGPGQTTVTVTCGAFSDTVEITSTVDPDYDPNFVLEWNCDSDITLKGYGAKWRIYNGSVPVSKIVFSSSDESVATVEDGWVTIWKNGDVTITAAYGNQVITMVVRARDVKPPEETVEPEYFLYTQYGKLNAYDVTIAVGESLTFTLRDKDGVKITEGVTFTVTDETYITVTENGRITGVAATGGTAVYVEIEYEGVVYKCLIRVRNP